MQSTLENPSPFVKSSEQEEQISHSVVVRSSTMLCERTEYDRNVVIHCDVENTSLTIVGNASFKGSIVNSTIMCFGQLRVAGSCQKSTLYARGNISAFIVRDSDLFSEQNIIIHREASDSTIQATASIFAATAKIVDSRISACDGMIVYRVRNEEEHSCELELGNIFLRRRKECILYRRMLTDFHSLKTKREVVSALQHTREQGLLHTPPGAQLLRAEAELEQLIEHSRKSEEEYRKLCEQWAQPSTFRISVLASIDAGTLVRIGEQQMREGMDRAETEYLLEDGQLQARYNSLKV